MDKGKNMNQFIIESTGQTGIVFLTVIEAEGVSEAIDIKIRDRSVGEGTVTGATTGLKRSPGQVLWGEVMRDIKEILPIPLIPQYQLVNREVTGEEK